MLGNFGAVIFAIGIGAWVYSKFIRRTNNPKTSLIASIATGVLGLIVFLTIYHSFLS